MPRIPDTFLECVVYIYPSVEDAQQARKVGGSGFLIQVPVNDEGVSMSYVVTNSHVARKGQAIRINNTTGTADVIPVALSQWIHHPAGDDVAIVPIALSTQFQCRTLPTSYFLTRDDLNAWNVGPGDEVYFMGRFIQHDGMQKNTPIVRFGAIAMMPGEPIRQDERGFGQESFLIEARSLSGFSGSPVMLYIPPFSNRFVGGDFEGGVQQDTTTMALLGIDWGSLRLGDEALTNTGIMAVVPVWKLSELLEDDDVRAMRDVAARELKNPYATLDVANELRAE